MNNTNKVNTMNNTMNNNMNGMTLQQLKAEAKAMGLKGYSKLSKSELIKLLAAEPKVQLELLASEPKAQPAAEPQVQPAAEKEAVVNQTPTKEETMTNDQKRARFAFEVGSSLKEKKVMTLAEDCGASSQPVALAHLLFPDVDFYVVTDLGMAKWLAKDYKFLYSDTSIDGDVSFWSLHRAGHWQMREESFWNFASSISWLGQPDGFVPENVRVLSQDTISSLKALERALLNRGVKAKDDTLVLIKAMILMAQGLLKPMRAVFVEAEDFGKVNEKIAIQSDKGALNLAKYVKSLFNPMRGVASGYRRGGVSGVVLRVKEQRETGLYVGPKFFGKANVLADKVTEKFKAAAADLQAYADGANLISLSFAEQLVSKNSNAFFVGKLKDNMQVFTSFTGRLYLAEGLVKGQFMIVPDKLLCYSVGDKRLWLDFVATEIKAEVKVADEEGKRNFLLAATGTQTKIKDKVSTDKQKVLAGFEAGTEEFAALVEALADAAIARFQGTLDFAPEYNPLLAEQLENEDSYEGSMSTVKLLEKVKANGFDPRAIPGLYVAMANQAADKGFDISRAKLRAEVLRDGERETIAFDAYPIAWIGDWLKCIALLAPMAFKEYTVGSQRDRTEFVYNVKSLLNFKVQPHTLYLGAMAAKKLPAAYTQADEYGVVRLDGFLNRRPTSFSGGSPVTIEFLPANMPAEMQTACWCSADPATFKAIFSDCDGGDQDDSYQVWIGEAARLQKEMTEKKSSIVMTNEADRSALREKMLDELYRAAKSFGNRAKKDRNARKVHSILSKALDEIHETHSIGDEYAGVYPASYSKEDLKAGMHWPTATASSPCVAWVGSAANLDMLFMAAVHGIVRFKVADKAALRDALSFGLGTMLSDIVDAEVQGKNIFDGATALADRQIASAYVVLQMIARDYKCPVMGMPEIFERRLAFGLRSLAWSEHTLVQVREEIDGETITRTRRIPVKDSDGVVIRQYGKILPLGWSLISEMERYISSVVTHVEMELRIGSMSNHLAVIKQGAHEIWKELDSDLRDLAEETYQEIHAYHTEYAKRIGKIRNLFGDDVTSDLYKDHMARAHAELMANIIPCFKGEIKHDPENNSLRYALAVHAWRSVPEFTGKSPSYDAKAKRFSIVTGALSILKLDDAELPEFDENGDLVVFEGLYRDGISVLEAIAAQVQSVNAGFVCGLANRLAKAKFIKCSDAFAWIEENFTPGMSFSELAGKPGFAEMFSFTKEEMKGSVKNALRKADRSVLDLIHSHYGDEPVEAIELITDANRLQKLSPYNNGTYGYYCKKACGHGVEPEKEEELKASAYTFFEVKLLNVKAALSSNIGSYELVANKVESFKKASKFAKVVPVGVALDGLETKAGKVNQAVLLGYTMPTKEGKPKLIQFDKALRMTDLKNVCVAANSVWFVKTDKGELGFVMGSILNFDGLGE